MDDIATRTKTALRRLAKSVVVITTQWQGKRYAMAATAVEGLSLDPPSMLVCIAKTASLATPLAAGATFTINLLRSDQAEISARCGAPWQGEERFAIGSWSQDANSPPCLNDAQVSFRCTPDLMTEYGTHLLIIGKIEDVRIEGDIDPLIYFDGKYHKGVAAQLVNG